MASLRPRLKERFRALIRPGLSTLLGPIAGFFRHHLASTTAVRALTVKVLNLCLARYHFQARTTAVLSRPYGLVVDPINNCNLACPGCVHSARAKELQVFSWNSGMLSSAVTGLLAWPSAPSAQTG